MARVKLTEAVAKKLLFPQLTNFPATTSTRSGELKKFFGDTPLVVKVDQAVKKRGKQGLVAVNIAPVQVVTKIREWSDKGYSSFLVEPLIIHPVEAEQFLSLIRTRYGWQTLYSSRGGIDIEKHWDEVTDKLPTHLSSFVKKNLTPALDRYHLTSLELNPLIIGREGIIPLDAAAEIDDAALGLAELSQYHLTPVSDLSKTSSELAVNKLDASTPASLKFKLINPQGHIWMLLSGGGASLVLADEVADIGLGNELANYGEYSGAPSSDDTYAYTKIILMELLKVKGDSPKALVIAGGVANFTDVAKTFKGLIRSMQEKSRELQKAELKVFVRRGGPNEKKGLAIMRKFLEDSRLLGAVYGHDTPLTKVISDVSFYLNKGLK